MPCYQNVGYQDVLLPKCLLPKCPVTKMSVTKTSITKVSFTEMSGYLELDILLNMPPLVLKCCYCNVFDHVYLKFVNASYLYLIQKP